MISPRFKKHVALSTIYSAMLISGMANSASIKLNDEKVLISDDQSANTYSITGSELSLTGASGVIGSDPTKNAIDILVVPNSTRSTININGGTVNGIINGLGFSTNSSGNDIFIKNGTLNGRLLFGTPPGNGQNIVKLIDSKINAPGGNFGGRNSAIQAHSVDGFLLSNSVVNNEDGGGIDIQQFHVFEAPSVIDKSTISVKNGIGVFSAHDKLEVSDTFINAAISPDAGDITPQAIKMLTGATVDPEDLYVSQLKLNSSTLNSDGSGIYLINSDAKISGSNINAKKVFGVRTTGGNLSLAHGTKINAAVNAVGLSITTNPRSTNTGQRQTNINISDSEITADKNASLAVNNDVIAKINTYQNTVLSTGGQQAVTIAKNADVQMQMNDSHINGDVAVEKDGKLDLNLLHKSTFTGAAQNIDTLSVRSDSHWSITDSSSVGSLNNIGGIITFSPSSTSRGNNSFKTLNVANDYRGYNAQLVMNTQLGNDNSPTDQMIINGNTSGETRVKVNNSGGIGDITQKGIELITVKGNSDGEFKQDGRIVAGVYDYFLGRGAEDKGTDNKNWYLTSELSETKPPVDPGGETKPPVDPGGETKPPVHRIAPMRPEGASYAANLQAANSMFITRLHDRSGSTSYVNPLTGETEITSLWIKNEGSHLSSKDSSGQLKTKGNRYVLQMGGDIFRVTTPQGNWRVGLMAGYGNQQTNTTTNVRNYDASAKGKVYGYSTGLYGTWYENNTDSSGAYIDTWAMYSWFKNSVQGKGLANEKYNSDGFTASVESGYTFALGGNDRTNYYIQPKAQAIWMGVKSDKHRENTGATVQGDVNNNVMARLGVRAFLRHDVGAQSVKPTVGSSKVFEPFVEANWLHNTDNYGTVMRYKADRRSTHQEGSNNIIEVKLGATGQVTEKLNIWEAWASKGGQTTSVIQPGH